MKTPDKILLSKLDAIIDTHLQQSEYGVDEICRDMAVSRSQLYRLIKGESGLSPSLYIRQRRLTKAKELLSTSALKAAEVAYQVGIDSPQNFSKYFTREFVVSPIAYRRHSAGP